MTKPFEMSDFYKYSTKYRQKDQSERNCSGVGAGLLSGRPKVSELAAISSSGSPVGGVRTGGVDGDDVNNGNDFHENHLQH